MTIEEALKLALANLRSGELTKEQQIKQKVIDPILEALDWDRKNPEWVPEYTVELPKNRLGSVDYALFGEEIAGKRSPYVFIEAKTVGKVTIKGVEQVFEYANNKGIPFLILTDGNIWEFYLSMGPDEPAERRFLRIELDREDRSSDHARLLDRFLRKGRVVLPQTMTEAHQLLKDEIQKRAAEAAIPDVWRSLLEAPDESLCAIIKDAVEGKCGFPPDMDDITKFLTEHVLPNSPRAALVTQDRNQELPTAQGSRPRRKAATKPRSGSKIIGFVLDRRPTETGSAVRTMVELIKEFQSLDSSFIERFEAKTARPSGPKSLVATTKAGLHKKPRLRKYSAELRDGWWIGTNQSPDSVRKHIATACEVMGIDLGGRLTLIER